MSISHFRKSRLKEKKRKAAKVVQPVDPYIMISPMHIPATVEPYPTISQAGYVPMGLALPAKHQANATLRQCPPTQRSKSSYLFYEDADETFIDGPVNTDNHTFYQAVNR